MVPATNAIDYIHSKGSENIQQVSYALGCDPAKLSEMIPSFVSKAIQDGLKDFERKLKGFANGTLLGFESKTSSPVQVARDKMGLCEGFNNLYFVGEGAGYAGGIISSAADGVRCALRITGSE